MIGINNELAGLVILVVDDEPDNIAVAKGILTFLGAKVYTAPNGIEGLKTLKQITPDLVLLDLSMPQMDGWEMLKEVRKQPDRATLPVIALTAHALPEDKQQVQNAGFDYYIVKPFRLATFLSEVRRVIR